MTVADRVFLCLSAKTGGSETAEEPVPGFLRLEPYVELARRAREASIDALFLADHPSLQRDNRADVAHTLDPLQLLGAVLSRVPDIGALCTASAVHSHAYELARRLQTLNWLTEGRVAWNVVASYNAATAENFGAALTEHDERYAHTDETVRAVTALWDSWRLGNDLDGQRGRQVGFTGKHVRTAGPLNIPQPPWGPPVIAQAGGSPQGIELAGRHGELVFASVLTVASGQAYRAELADAAHRHGRTGPIRLLAALRLTVGADEAEVRERALGRRRRGAADADGRWLADLLSLDLATLDRKRPLDELELAPGANLPQGFFRSITALIREQHPSFDQLVAQGIENHNYAAGTPVEIADFIEEWWRSGAVDGFVLSGADRDLELLFQCVIPVLQRRGVFPHGYTQGTLRDRFVLGPPQ